MNNRIKEIIAFEHLSDGEFADIVGINRSTLSHCLSGRNDVSKDIIIKIHNAYSYISINWLMFGEGDPGFPKQKISSGNLFDSLQPSGQVESEYRKEIGSNNPENKVKFTENKDIEEVLIVSEKSDQIEKTDKMFRKVDKIILYYSDNTFETFEKR